MWRLNLASKANPTALTRTPSWGRGVVGLLAAGLVVAGVARAEAPVDEGAPEERGGAEAWRGLWRIAWTRPEGWQPETLEATLEIGAALRPDAVYLSFNDAGASSRPVLVDLRPHSARFVFEVSVDPAITMHLDIFADGDTMHGVVEVRQGGYPTIPWSPVTGTRVREEPLPRIAAGVEAPWPEASPEEVGWSALDVHTLIKAADEAGITGLVLVKGGRLVVATGADLETRQNLSSVSMALSSLALPYLLDEGAWPNLDAPVGSVVGWPNKGPLKSISLRHALSHTTGLEVPNYKYWIKVAGDDFRADLSAARSIDPPGVTYAFSNRSFELLSPVVAHAAGVPLDAYLAPRLFEPLGIAPTWRRDPQGHVWVHTGVEATAVELAKVGMLLASDGRWEGQQVLPAGWVAEASQRAFDANEHAGLGWWRDPTGKALYSLGRGGGGGALLLVVPERNVVVAGVAAIANSAPRGVLRRAAQLEGVEID